MVRNLNYVAQTRCKQKAKPRTLLLLLPGDIYEQHVDPQIFIRHPGKESHTTLGREDSRYHVVSRNKKMLIQMLILVAVLMKT